MENSSIAKFKEFIDEKCKKQKPFAQTMARQKASSNFHSTFQKRLIFESTTIALAINVYGQIKLHSSVVFRVSKMDFGPCQC